MPRDLRTFTNCASPGVARSHKQLGGLAGLIISAWFQNKWITGASVIGFLFAMFFTPIGNPATWTVVAVVLIAALVDVKHWYFNERLLCITEDICAIGTIISSPTRSFDGDRKLNILLAPFTQRQCVQALRSHLDDNENLLVDPANFNDPPFHTNPPDLPSASARNNTLEPLRRYMASLRSKDPNNPDTDSNMFNQVVIGVVDRLLSDSSKDFFNHLFRKDVNHIPPGSLLSDAIPDDFDDEVQWQQPNAISTKTHFNEYRGLPEGLNPMFRFDVNRDPSSSKGHLVPYLHCEIEGNYIALLIDTVIMALVAFIASLIVLTSLFGPIGIIGAFIVLIITLLLKTTYDKWFENNGTPEEPDIDVDDPENLGGDPMTEATGDVVAVSGRWIMDTEHAQYFEIHPVRAYYLIARNVFGDEPVPIDTDEEQDQLGHENFDPTQIDVDRMDQICDFIQGTEDEDPPPQIERSAPEALSYGMTTYYGGGGFTIE